MKRPPPDEGRSPEIFATAARHGIVGADTRGTLVLIGGGATPGGEALGAFVSRVGGGGVVGLTTASADPVGAALTWRRDLAAAGIDARALTFPDFDHRGSARDREIAAAVADARGVFLGGGDQVKLVAALSGSRTERAIRDAFCAGAVVCGTSAGAAALTQLTMAGGEIDEDGNLVEQYLGPGLGLLGYGAIIDTHFSQRRRLQRLFLVVAEHRQLLGLGIDEDTALVVDRHVGEVVGASGVTFVDGRDSVRYDNAAEVELGRQLTISHLRVGIVGTHHRLDLEARELEVLIDCGLQTTDSRAQEVPS